MSQPTEIQIRPIEDDEMPAFCVAMAQGFGSDSDDGHADRVRAVMPLERTLAAFEGEQIVGTFGDFALTLTLPGKRQTAMAGTTMVTVRATHRRQGLLRSMMAVHLQTAKDRGDAIAGLWASETAIYGRFGFGLATELHGLKLDARRVTIDRGDSSLQVREIAADTISEAVAPLWSRIAQSQAGFIDREAPRWGEIVRDPENRREGGSARRHVIVIDPANPDRAIAYASYRMKASWQDAVPNGTIDVEVVVGESAEAHRVLWHYLTNVDLLPNVSYWNLPTNDSVAEMASNRRELHRCVNDGLYLRILDVPAALTARGYESDGTLALAVVDDLGHAAGTFELTGESGDATVNRSTAAADVTLDVRELSALLLGARSAEQFADLGLIEGEADKVALLGRLLRTAATPWCPEEF